MKVAFSANRERDSVNTESEGEPPAPQRPCQGARQPPMPTLQPWTCAMPLPLEFSLGHTCLLCRLWVGSPYLIPSLKSGTSCALALSDLGWENLVHCILETHSLVSAGV